MSSPADKLEKAATELSKKVSRQKFPDKAAYVYNPLDYAWAMHREYIRRYAVDTCKVLFMGMNPGPFGMAQTGIPFGEVNIVKDWLRLDEAIKEPRETHPTRPVTGLQCTRSEVSGKRLWGLFSERFDSAEAFFKEHYVLNYCPLLFLEEGGRNLTPDKLPAASLKELYHACDEHLRSVVSALSPDTLVGVGQFAESRLKQAFPDGYRVSRVLHPSPASPAANRGWAEAATRELETAGIWS